jgi:YgiT-type zinc finger domain-containing protein
MKKCLYCGSELKMITSIHKEYEGELTIAINNTPIIICKDCSEEYLSADVMEKINKIIKEVLENKNKYNKQIIIVNYNEFN